MLSALLPAHAVRVFLQHMFSVYSSGALKGRSAAEAFYVTCDATNNPSYVVEAGEVHVEVGVALSSPAEFIVINVSQFAGGNTTTETL